MILLLLPFLCGCSATYLAGKKSVKWDNDIAYQTITWDVQSTEEDIKDAYSSFVVETLQKLWYKDYLPLFQSNYRLDENERTFVIKIFKDRDARNRFLNRSEDLVRKSIRLSRKDFIQRFEQLQTGMPVEEVYRLLPELADFGGKQQFFSDHSEVKLGEYWFTFDFQGYLIGHGHGVNSSNHKTSDEWVF